AYYILVNASSCGLLLSVVVARADILHFMYLLPVFGMALGWIVDGGDIPSGWFEKAKPALVAYLVVAFVLFSAPLLMRAARAQYALATRRGVVRTSTSDTVLAYVQAKVAPGGTLFVYPYLPLYNYLTATVSPTRYEYFQPGMHTAEQAQEILSDLHSKRPSVVVFESSFSQKIPRSWPNTPVEAFIHDPVADYINEQYKTCAVLHSPQNWLFLFMVQKEMACP